MSKIQPTKDIFCYREDLFRLMPCLIPNIPQSNPFSQTNNPFPLQQDIFLDILVFKLTGYTRKFLFLKMILEKLICICVAHKNAQQKIARSAFFDMHQKRGSIFENDYYRVCRGIQLTKRDDYFRVTFNHF